MITSNNSSLPEVVGTAGIMVDAHDSQALTNSMENILASPALAEQLRSKGLKQAKRFDWEQSSKVLLELINKIGSSR